MAYENNTGYPSVTDVLSPFVDKRWFKDIHRIRGSEVHRVCTCKLVKAWAKKINPAWQGYVDSLMRWFDEWMDKIYIVETRYQDDLYKYTGKLDIAGWLKDKRFAIIDIKTSTAEYKTWKLQTAGYQMLFEKHNPDIKVDVRAGLRGREDGSKNALVNWYEDHETDKRRFLYANDLYHSLML